jgi:hypothetical protein
MSGRSVPQHRHRHWGGYEVRGTHSQVPLLEERDEGGDDDVDVDVDVDVSTPRVSKGKRMGLWSRWIKDMHACIH